MTVPQPPIVAAEERAWNNWFVDGITNIVVGVSVLLMAFCVLDPPHWPPRPLPVALWAITLLLYVIMAVRHRQIVEWLKIRITYPRTGYVRPPFPEDPAEAANLTTFSLNSTGTPPEAQLVHVQRRMTWMIAVALVAVGSLAFVIVRDRWVWSAVGAIFSAAMVVARKDFRLSWIMPVGLPVLGLYITSSVPRSKASAYFIAGMGMLFLLDGASKLIRYLLQNPAPRTPAA
jgi:hypothetical protein